MEKRKVTMRNVVFAGVDDDGNNVFHTHEATDYVPVEHLDAYVEDARKRWPAVVVGDEHDPGPGGDDGDTYVAHLIGA